MKQTIYLMAIREALDEEMERDEKVFIIGENVQQGTFGTTSTLVQKFGPERVMDTPLAETAVAGAAVGAAMAGFRPVADMMFADFMYIAGDEIMIKAAKWHFLHGGKVSVPLVLMAAMGGGMKIGAEHSMCPESIIMHTAGLKLAIPSTPYDAKGLLKTAIRDNNPVVFFYHKGLLGVPGEIPEEEYLVPFGQADVKREGSDVTVVATSRMVHLSLAVAEELKDKVSVEVIDPRTLEPLDIDTIIASVKKTGRVVVADEDNRRCGVTSEIGMQIMEKGFDYLDAPVQRVAAADLPIASGFMEEHILPQPKDIVAAIEAVAT
ncbi:MAG: alpha-ketoacid dehydrogenase subunit beta [Deltaproteobacteria bacterium]|nr:alpha-ketoacid dehydrogenase subunit beta [Deltaproteobacteria bacterium]MBW2085037.1 alpha-ketoacid dehydrogenase subunit beta [Deltaproteobacteria bacterium]